MRAPSRLIEPFSFGVSTITRGAADRAVGRDTCLAGVAAVAKSVPSELAPVGFVVLAVVEVDVAVGGGVGKNMFAT